ncbi:MAG: response regulator [Verrucomicrobiales bacterium]|nr:response regulator [Verrucomicrobiales bacterium]
MSSEPFSILMIEDDLNDVLLMKRAFAGNCISNSFVVCRDGEEAVEYLSNAARSIEGYHYPGLIIIDLKMPRKSGLEVLKWLKDHPECYVIPTIVFTSSSQRMDVKLAYGLGANSYIVKPATFDELKETVRTIFAYWNLCEKLSPGEMATL